MLLIPVFHLFFLDLVEGFGMSDFEEAVLNPEPETTQHVTLPPSPAQT